jgi:DNA-binding CsgD family transcriptional regulator
MLNAPGLVLAKGIYLPHNVLLSEPSSVPFRPRPMSPVAAASRSGRDFCLPRGQPQIERALQGKPIKLIWHELKLGEGTIKRHMSAVLLALNVTTRTQAIVAAHRLGLVFEATFAGTAIKPNAKSRSRAPWRDACAAVLAIAACAVLKRPGSQWLYRWPSRTPVMINAGTHSAKAERSARMAPMPVS